MRTTLAICHLYCRSMTITTSYLIFVKPSGRSSKLQSSSAPSSGIVAAKLLANLGASNAKFLLNFFGSTAGFSPPVPLFPRLLVSVFLSGVQHTVDHLVLSLLRPMLHPRHPRLLPRDPARGLDHQSIGNTWLGLKLTAKNYSKRLHP